ncbi:hypothetical protein UR09_06760 [Candidatus Nitromaritima sp. SCGC AAA799-A02]|nr:hypothetical protein UR09_06760 [Candidatus Nitromaritima sp. SCGC AAA799-A02]
MHHDSGGIREKLFCTLMAVWIVAGFGLGTAESAGPMISLNSPGVELQTFRVARSAEIKLNNDSHVTLHDFTIIQVASGKKMLSVKNLKPSASLN